MMGDTETKGDEIKLETLAVVAVEGTALFHVRVARSEVTAVDRQQKTAIPPFRMIPHDLGFSKDGDFWMSRMGTRAEAEQVSKKLQEAADRE